MNMKRNTRFLRAAALGTALLLAAVIGCKNESDGETGSNTLPSTDGLLTITGIDACFKGKYAFVASSDVVNGSELNLWGAEAVDKSEGTTTGIKIEGGKALIPIYAYTFERDIPEEESVKSSIFSSYSGNGTVQLWVYVFDKRDVYMRMDNEVEPPLCEKSFDVIFADGKASKMWGEGE